MRPERPLRLNEAFFRALWRVNLVVVLVQVRAIQRITIEHPEDPKSHLFAVGWDEGNPGRGGSHLAGTTDQKPSSIALGLT